MEGSRLRRLLAVLGLGLVVTIGTSCQTNQMNKETWGTVLGTAGGALAGAAIAGGDHRWLGAGIGGAVGFLAGKMIGRHLDQRDRELLAAQTLKSLEDPAAGSATWKSDRSTASADIETGEVQYESQPKAVKHVSGVEALPPIRLENREYQTTSALRVRAGPSTRYATLASLQPGEVVRSGGRTEDGWLMLVKQDVTMGYVHGGYVRPYDPIQQAKSEGVDLDAVEVAPPPKREAFAGVDLDAVETRSSTVTAQKGCRDVKIQVTTQEGTENEATRACQRDDGVWELG